MRHSSRKKRRIYAAPGAALVAKETQDSGFTPQIQHSAHPILNLQRLIGNRAVRELVADSAIHRQVATVPAFSPPSATDTVVTDRPTLSFESEGPDVIFLQRRLNVHGANLVEDGVFGPLTRQAVIEFQTAHAPPVDGIVGPVTWGALLKEPVSPEDKDKTDKLIGPAVDKTPLSEIDVGPFAPYVAANFIDKDIASMLNAMKLRFQDTASITGGIYSTDTADVALQDLANGNLVGIVRVSNIGKLRPRLPVRHQRRIDDIEQDGIERKAGTLLVRMHGVVRTIIVLADDVMDGAELPGADRGVAQDVIAHELSHHRNIDAAITDSRTPISSEEYVNVPLALKQQEFGTTATGEKRTASAVRTRFIHELTARHAEFLLNQERLKERGEEHEPLLHGEFFNAALEYALTEPESYEDNGYLTTLAAIDEVAFRKQVAIWMRHLNERKFHSNPFEEFIRHNFFEREFQLAQSHNFDRFADKSRGLHHHD